MLIPAARAVQDRHTSKQSPRKKADRLRGSKENGARSRARGGREEEEENEQDLTCTWGVRNWSRGQIPTWGHRLGQRGSI